MPIPFFHTLRDLRGGRSLEELGEQLAQVVKAVRETGKAGKVTLTLTVKPAKKGVTSYLLVEDEISGKVPTFDQADTVFFFTKDGGLTRSDPTQQELQLRAAPPANVNSETGEISNG